MRGKRVPRKGGWDTHGLPVEIEVEKMLGLDSKPAIENYGIAEFNRHCRESVMEYVQQWEDMTDRVAFWIDMSDAYRTYTPEYVESCWWIFKTLWDAGLIYEARRTTPHCPRCESSLSSHELSPGHAGRRPRPGSHGPLPRPQQLAPRGASVGWRHRLPRLDHDSVDAAGQLRPRPQRRRDLRRRRDFARTSASFSRNSSSARPSTA